MRGEHEGETVFLRADQQRVPPLSDPEAAAKMALLYLTTAVPLLRGPARPGRASSQPAGKRCLVPACRYKALACCRGLFLMTPNMASVCAPAEGLSFELSLKKFPGEPAFQPATTNLQPLPRIWLAVS